MFRALLRFSHTKLESIEATVFEILKNLPKVQPDKVSKTATFQSLGLDSLDTIDIILDLEDKFSVKLTNKEVLQINSVLDAITIFFKYK